MCFGTQILECIAEHLRRRAPVTELVKDDPIIFDMNSCTFEFTDGLAVKNVLTDLESTRLVIRNLPDWFRDVDLRERLKGVHGMVRLHISRKTSRIVAVADFDTPDEAKKACIVLNGCEFPEQSLTAYLVPVVSSGPTGTLRDTIVHISWFTPTLVAYAHYAKLQHAHAAARRVQGRQFDGWTMKAMVQEPTPFQKTSFTVVVQGVGGDVTRPSLEIDLKRLLRCSHLDLTEPTYDVDELQSLLASEGGSLESLDILPANAGDVKTKAIARYGNAADANRAVNTFHNVRLECLNGSPVWLSCVPAIKFTIPLQQYECLAPHFQTLQATDKTVRWSMYKQDTQGHAEPRVTIRLAGNNIPALGKVKAKLESSLLGYPISDTNGLAWDDKLASYRHREGSR